MKSLNSSSLFDSTLCNQLLKVSEITEKLTIRLLEVEEKLSVLEDLQRESIVNTNKLAAETIKITDHKLSDIHSKLAQISAENIAVKSNQGGEVFSTDSTDDLISCTNSVDSNFDNESHIETQYIDDPQMPMTSC
tara:strand:+ start:103 stop:507 length:405 start_codon:yes stop_codon:yes gene_type:complete